MVRNYKKTKCHNGWNDIQLQLAINHVIKGNSIKSSANKYDIPRSTLQRKLKQNSMCSSPCGFKRTFTDEQEVALSEMIVDMERRLTGFSTKELRKLAYDFATKLKISHNFDRQSGLAGKDWIRSFMKLHNLSNRKAEPTSAARANGFNKNEVDKFFILLREVMERYNITPANIWNVDETGISVVPKSASKVIAQRGRKQVGGKTSAERGETVTAEICMSASGLFMPPMLIFPRVKANEEYLVGKPEGSWAVWRKSGWIETDIFTNWFKQFIQFSKASSDNPVLLLLDGHYTHVRNLEVAELGRTNGVIILCFPPHCTHRMQPLDVSFMKPLSTYYAEEINQFQRNGARVQMKDIFQLIGKAWQKAAKIDTAVNAFKKTGIHPLNVHIFDSEFNSAQNNKQPAISPKKCTESFNMINDHKKVLNEIIFNKEGECSDLHKNLNPIFQELPARIFNDTIDLSHSVPEQTVQIPLSYIINAKPLIALLNSVVAETENKENIPQKKITKSRKRGAATIVTSEDHVKELRMQKPKKVNKESTVLGKKRSLPKIKSDVIIKNEISNTSGIETNKNLGEIHYQVQENCGESILINTKMFPTADCTYLADINGTFLVQSENGQYEPFVIETIDL